MPSNNSQINIGVKYNVDQASVNAVKKSLQDLQNIKTKDFSGPRKQLEQIKETAGKVQAALTKAFNVNLNSLNTKAFNTALNQAGLNIDKIYNQFSKAGAQGQVAFSRMASSVLTTNLQLKQTNSLVSQMGETMANTVKWGIASSIMNNFSNSVQQAFNYVKNLDSSLNDIRIVTKQSADQMANFAVQANNSAQALGRSTMDYTKAALTFYQQGLDEATVQARTQSVLKAQNITGAGQEMADYLTAVWNGYKVANEEAELYVDKLAAVADSSASNMSELAVAMSKVASSANMLGVPVDKLNAQIATITATTRQAPQSVGNALKTIYSRINDISTGAEDAEISLGNYSSKMLDVGISVLDANGNLRDTGDVLDEIGGKWQNLSREQQIYLARTMAGQRQYNNLLALFDNWSKYSDLVNISMQAQGTTAQKNAIYMESLAAKMEQLGAAGEKVKAALIDEEDLKGLVDFGTGAVNLFGNLIESIGGGKGALLAFGSVFTQIFSGTIAKEINNVVTNFQNVRNNLNLLEEDIANLKVFQKTGADNQAVQQLTKYLGELQKYYSVLDAASINNQKNLIRELDELENSKIVLQDKKQVVEQYANSLGIVQTSKIWEQESNEVLKLNTALGDLDGSAANLRQLYSRFQQTGQITDKLKQSFERFVSSYEKINPQIANKLREAFANIEINPDQLTYRLSSALNDAQQKAKEYSQTINTAVQQQDLLNTKTQQLKNIIQNNNKGFQQLFNITNLTNFASLMGQTASVVNNIVNVFRTLNNENLSAGEKILRSVTSISTSLLLVTNIISKVNSILKIDVALSEKKRLEQQKITLQLRKQELLRKKMILENANPAEYITKGKNGQTQRGWTFLQRDLKEVTSELSNIDNQILNTEAALSGVFAGLKSTIVGAFSGIGSLLVTLATNPFTWVAAATVAIGVGLYKAWNKAADAAKQASETAKQAKESYERVNEVYNNLKSSLSDLDSAKDRFNSLTKGTQEWRDALQEVNQKVLKLAQDFPQLQSSIKSTGDGLLYLTKEGEQDLVDKYRKQTFASNLSYGLLNQQSVDAQNYSLITNASRDIDFVGGLTPEQLEQVVTAINQHGSYILKNSDFLEQMNSLQEQDIQVIRENTGKIIDLANEVKNNTTAAQNLTTSIIKSGLEIDDKYNQYDPEILSAIAGGLIQQASKTLDQKYYYPELQGARSELNTTRALNDQIIKEAYKEYLKEQGVEVASVKVKTGYGENDIDGISGLEYTVKGSKEKTPVSIEKIITDLATRDAMAREDEYYQLAAQIMDTFGEQQSRFFSLFQQGLKNVDWSLLSKQDIENLLGNFQVDLFSGESGYITPEITKAIANYLGIDLSELQNSLEEHYQDVNKSIKSYISQLPKSVQNAFNQIIDNPQQFDQLNQASAEAIGNLLKTSLLNGTESFDNTKEILKGLNIQDILPFTELVNNLDSSLSLQDFKEQLKQSDIQLNKISDQTLEKLLNSLKEVEEEGTSIEENYKNLHDIVNKLKTGGIVDSNQAEILKKAGIDIEEYFLHMADGSLKLKTDAQSFYEYVNNISLSEFKQKIEDLQKNNKNLEEIQNNEDIFNSAVTTKKSTYRDRDENGKIVTYEREDVVGTDTNLLQAQFNFLQSIGKETEQIKILHKELQQGLDLDPEQIQLVAEEVRKYREEWQQIPQTIKQNNEQIENTKEQIASTATTIAELRQLYYEGNFGADTYSQFRESYLEDQIERLKITREEYDATYDLLNQRLEETSQSFQSLSDAEKEVELDQFTSKIYDIGNALDQLKQISSDTFDEIQYAIDNGFENLDGIEGFSQIKTILSDIFEMPLDNQQIVDNLGIIKELADGDITALERLQLALAEDFVANIEVDAEHAGASAQHAISAIEEILQFTDLQDLPLGVSLDDAGFTNALIELADKAGLAANDINELLANIGFEPEVIDQQIPFNEQTVTHNKNTNQYTVEMPEQLGGGTRTIVMSGENADGAYAAGYVTIPIINGKKIKRVSSSASGLLSRPTYSAPKTSGGGGGGKGGGGKGSSPKSSTPKQPTQVKPQQLSEAKDSIEDRSDVYHDINLALEKQEDKLDDIQKEQKKLVNKDRLKNLQQQNKQLEKQKDLLDQKSGIAASELVRLRNEIVKDLGDGIKFDKNGQIANYNAALDKARDNYNSSIADYNKKVLDAENAYNKYVDQYNSMSGDAQEANKKELERQKDLMEAAKKSAEKSLNLEKDKYDAIKDNIKEYEDTLKLQRDIANEQQEIQDKIYENLIAMSKIKVDLSIDTGDFERDWLDFENKFIKKLDKDDFLGSAKASAKELMSYFNSKQVQQTADQIRKIRNQIDIMNRGGTSNIYGTNLAQAKEDLEEYMKQQMDDLQDIQDKIDDIKENYLDAIDDAKDKMEDQIDQYERVNDLVEHNMKMVELLYGDKAYDSMQKYYGLQQENNERELESLRKQQEYWKQKMDNEVVGSDAWQKFKDNLDDVTDDLNNKLEDMIDNLSDRWENRVDGIIARLNNALTGGRGLDYLDEQWDYINNYDDQFLDTFESKTGIDEVERLYQSTIDGLAGSPKSQQALNKLMNDQLKLLREKDHLTEYDLERAKASLEVQKARLALEQARDNKTKMRLRRDSQGNYTYQYVADEEKLGELQAALADAQANLYETDKDHYKQNLNNLYDTYKEYIEKMRDLTEEYNNTQDEEERKRIQGRMDLLKESTNKLMSGLTQDNKYLLQYLNGSFFDGMGVDTSTLTMEEQMEIMEQNIPQMQSNIQDLSDTIVGQGGILPATADMMKEINEATIQYDKDVQNMLNSAGTSLQTIQQATDAQGVALDKNITDAQNLITANDELIKSCQAQIEAMEKLLDYMDKYINKIMSVQTLLSNLRSAYNTGQNLNGSNLTADNIGMTDWGMDTTSGMEYTGNPKTDAAAIKQQIDALMAQYEKFLAGMSIATFDTGGYTGSWGDAEGRLAFLHQGELVLNQDDTQNILNAVQVVRSMANAINSFANGEINSLATGANGLLAGISNTEHLDQNVHIEANFPNVTQHTEIEQAFNNLVNMASMRASGYRD